VHFRWKCPLWLTWCILPSAVTSVSPLSNTLRRLLVSCRKQTTLKWRFNSSRETSDLLVYILTCFIAHRWLGFTTQQALVNGSAISLMYLLASACIWKESGNAVSGNRRSFVAIPGLVVIDQRFLASYGSESDSWRRQTLCKFNHQVCFAGIFICNG